MNKSVIVISVVFIVLGVYFIIYGLSLSDSNFQQSISILEK